MNFFKKFIGHLKMVITHKHYIFIHCAKAGILWQGIAHDLSKFSPTEFIPGVKYYTGTKSPTLNEREAIGCSQAWIHHKGRNKHHYEYWTDYIEGENQLTPVEMPFNYAVEMFCDRLAASKTYKGKSYKQTDAYDYFKAKTDKGEMHPNTEKLLETLLRMTAERGEETTFLYIKNKRKTQFK